MRSPSKSSSQPTSSPLPKSVVQLSNATAESDNWYRGVFENAVFGAFQTTPDGRFTAANDALARLLGYDSSEQLIQTVTDIAHQIHVDPERRAELSRALQELGAVHNFEAQAYRKDGSVIWLSLSARAARDDTGALVGFEGIVEDVTARKKSEEARQDSEQRLQLERERMKNTVSNIPGIVWEAYGRPDEETQRIDFVSDYVELMLGYRVEEWLATANFWLKIVHPEDRERAAAESAAIFAGTREPISEFRWLAKDGRTVWVEAQSSVIRDSSGSPIGMRGVTMDITERKREEERQAFLAKVSAILSSSLEYERTLDNLARLVVGGMADVCSIDMVEGDLARRVAFAHVDPEKEKLFSLMEPTYRPDPKSRHPVLRVTRSRRSELLNPLPDTTLRAAARDRKHLSALRALGVRSVMIVPLTAGPKTLGAMTIASAESGRLYDAADLALAEELARRAALAIENARLFQDTESARQAAEQAAMRTARLQSITAALSQALTPTQVSETVIDAAIGAMDARSGVIVLLASDAKLQMIAARGESSQFVDSWDDFAAAPSPPIVEAIRAGQPFFAQSKDELLSAYPDLSRLSVVPDRSFACIPLTVEARAIGAMVLTFECGRAFTEEDREFIVAFARQGAQALERARLFAAEQQARATAEEARQRVEFLAGSSSIFLSGSVDYEGILQRLAELSVPRIADWCAIDMVDAEGNLRRMAVLHRDPVKLRLANELQESYPAKLGDPRGAANVIRTGQAEFHPTIPDELLAASTPDPALLKILRGLGLRSAICAPLRARGRTLGAVTFVRAESGPVYTHDDLEFVEEICNRAALAIDNAGLYDAEQKARAAAEAAQQRLWFLAEANAVLSSSLDLETTLTRVAGLAVPWLADCCAVHLFPVEGAEARSAVAHVDPSKQELVRELHSRYAPAAGEAHPILRMIETEIPVLVEEVDESNLADVARDDEHRQLLRHLDFKSYMAVPLIARGRLFGAMTFATSAGERRYGQQDLTLVEELARRAALALDNARLYEEAQRVQDALRVALEAKDEFLGVMSHELRTPITAIYGGARVLRSRGERLDDESKARLLEDVEQESERLFRMVENLLVLARLELGQEVATEPVLAQRIIGKLASAFKQRRPARPVIINVDQESAPVAAEPHYLEHVLRNLLTNADKYSPSDSPIEIETRTNDGETEIAILDRGPGIAPEESEIIFERFYRSDRTANRAAGIGLGLTVCKRLMEAQAGRVWARPREGGGLEIGVTLPIYKED